MKGLSLLVLAACTPPDSGETAGDVPFEAVSAWLQVQEDGTARVHLTVDPEGADVALAVTVPPSAGALSGEAPDLVYAPNVDFSGLDGFDFTATRGSEVSTASVVLDVLPRPDAPVAAPSALETVEDTPVTGQLPATDADGDALYWTASAAPAHGVLDVDPWTGEFSYTPDPDWSGVDSAQWFASDGALTTGAIELPITVTAAPDAPVAVDSEVAGTEDTTAVGALTGFDVDGDQLTFVLAVPPAHGTAVVDPDGTVTWTPDPDFAGTDQLSFTVSDGTQTSAPAVATLSLVPAPDAPVASPLVLATDEDLPVQGTVSASDPDGQGLLYELVVPPASGSAEIEETTGLVTYTPSADFNGADSFAVLVTDGALYAETTVDIDVAPTPDPPVALDGESLGGADAAQQGTLAAIDPDGDLLAFSVATPPAHGKVSLAGAVFDYQPDLGFVGDDSFTFTADDGTALSAPATETLTVVPTNRSPVADDVAYHLVENIPFQSVLPVSDPDGDPLTVTVTSPFGHCTASIVGSTLFVTPDADFVGIDVALYQATDPGGLHQTGQILVDVAADADTDGVPDDDDDCPADVDPLQIDADADGTGDGCDCTRDDFASGYDPAIWASSSGTIVNAVVNRSPPASELLSGSAATLVSQPVDVTGCAGLEVEYWALRAGTASVASDLTLSAWDGTAFVPAGTLHGSGLADSRWVRQSIWLPASQFPAGTAQLELSFQSSVPTDAVYVDDLMLACDTDGDHLGDCSEAARSLPGDDADFDADGLPDGLDLLVGADPAVADSDGDGVLDGDDVCPAIADPLQADLDGDGIGDACDLAVSETFVTNALGSDWAKTGGDFSFSSAYAASVPWSVDLGGTGTLALAPHTLPDGCLAWAWEASLKRGPDNPESTDDLVVEAWDGEGWAPMGFVAGNNKTDALFYPVGGSFPTDGPLAHDGLQIRLRSSGSFGQDDFFVDDVYLGCDADQDDLPDLSEGKAFGTDPTLFDTDGDGAGDGTEVLVLGTDPLDPLDY